MPFSQIAAERRAIFISTIVQPQLRAIERQCPSRAASDRAGCLLTGDLNQVATRVIEHSRDNRPEVRRLLSKSRPLRLQAPELFLDVVNRERSARDPVLSQSNLEGACRRMRVRLEQQLGTIWDAEADEYQRMHMDSLSDEKAFAWDIWRISENEIGALGDVEGVDVLELGCGAAQWSIALAKRGARVTGLDNSARQLEHAKRLVDEAGVDVTLVLSPAEATPFEDASFDRILSDYGATLFSDPYATIPECARILRPGGELVFATTGPLMMACWGCK